MRAQEDHAATWLVLLAHREGGKGRLVAGEIVPGEGGKASRVRLSEEVGSGALVMNQHLLQGGRQLLFGSFSFPVSLGV